MKVFDRSPAARHPLHLNADRTERTWLRQRTLSFVLGASLLLWAAIILLFVWLV